MTREHFIERLTSDEYASWSYEEAGVLYDYYDQLSEDIGEDIEFDPVSIRCDWSRYDSALEKVREHTGNDLSCLNIDWLDASQSENDEIIESKAREWLDDRTTVLDVESYVLDQKDPYAPYINIKSILVMQF